MCRLLAYKKADPPISLGLFGDWGTGKTFFMEKMEEWFERHRSGGDGVYAANIACIRFNAWHFIDKDLWASLTAEVFDQLGQKVGGGRLPNAQSQREALQLELVLAEQRQKDAEARLRERESELSRLEDSLTSAAIARNALRAATAEQQTQWDEVAKALNLPPFRTASSAAREQWLEWRGVWGFLQALWTSLSNSTGRRLLLWGGVGMALGYWLLVLAMKAQPNWQWMAGYVSWLASLITGVVASLAPHLRSAKTVIAAVNKVRAANEELALGEKRKAEEAAGQLRAELEAAKGKVTEVRESIKKLEPGQRIADFIIRRRDSTDYTQHLGVVARSRRDFSQLSLLLAQAAQSPSAAGESKGEAGVDRIILFIDDLDRCPENIVVDVLQAVHLLLAFPLFVVVVAVDSRWLLHSLRQHSQALADDDVDVASPVNYLEKIFQIPFRLRPHRGGRGFDRLIDTLTAPAKHEESPAPDPSPDPARADQTVKPPPPPAPPPAPVIAPRPPEVARPVPEVLHLEDWEKNCMKVFAGLIPTPRATKRFLNTYRLIRSMAPADKRQLLVGTEHAGDHRAVLLLLALMTGYPDRFAPLLLELQRAAPKTDWWVWFAQQGLFDADSTAAQAIRQTESLLPRTPATTCEPFIRWAAVVARFSFHPAIQPPRAAQQPANRALGATA